MVVGFVGVMHMHRLGALIIAVSLVCAVDGSAADLMTSKARKNLFASQTGVLDTRAAQQYANSVRLKPQAILVPGAPGSIPVFGGNYRGVYLQEARAAARHRGSCRARKHRRG